MTTPPALTFLISLVYDVRIVPCLAVRIKAPFEHELDFESWTRPVERHTCHEVIIELLIIVLPEESLHFEACQIK